MEALRRVGIKAPQLLIQMSSRYPGCSIAPQAHLPRLQRMLSQSFLCLEMPVKSKEWVAEEASHGKHRSSEGRRVHRKEVWAEDFTSLARSNSGNHTFPF